MTEIDPRAQEVVKFWHDAGYDAWFSKNPSFDAEFHSRFLDLHYAAAARELDSWMEHPESALALMILLDQFPRNCFRNTGHMFATDPLARHLARAALAAGHIEKVARELQVFFLLPFEHSEDMDDQDLSVELFAPYGADYLKYAIVHRDIIEKFGRFPHRNKALGRETTQEEQAFLEGGGFSG